LLLPHEITSIGKRAFDGCGKLNPAVRRDIEGRFGSMVFEL
jgi:hypothetical protein